MSNQVFADNSWYICNAHVRANHNDLQNNVHSTAEFLELFMENLLTGANHELKNRYMHIDYSETSQSANPEISKCKNCTLKEFAILREISNNPSITQKALAEAIGKSEQTVKTRTVEL